MLYLNYNQFSCDGIQISLVSLERTALTQALHRIAARLLSADSLVSLHTEVGSVKPGKESSITQYAEEI